MITDFICFSLLYLLPAYRTFKHLKYTRDVAPQESEALLKFWLVIGSLSWILQYFDTVLFWLPLYSFLKIGFCFWISHLKGAEIMHDTQVFPFLHRHESKIDEHLGKVTAGSFDILKLFGYWLFEKARQMVSEGVIKIPTMFMMQMVNMSLTAASGESKKEVKVKKDGEEVVKPKSLPDPIPAQPKEITTSQPNPPVIAQQPPIETVQEVAPMYPTLTSYPTLVDLPTPKISTPSQAPIEPIPSLPELTHPLVDLDTSSDSTSEDDFFVVEEEKESPQIPQKKSTTTTKPKPVGLAKKTVAATAKVSTTAPKIKKDSAAIPAASLTTRKRTPKV